MTAQLGFYRGEAAVRLRKVESDGTEAWNLSTLQGRPNRRGERHPDRRGLLLDRGLEAAESAARSRRFGHRAVASATPRVESRWHRRAADRGRPTKWCDRRGADTNGRTTRSTDAEASRRRRCRPTDRVPETACLAQPGATAHNSRVRHDRANPIRRRGGRRDRRGTGDGRDPGARRGSREGKARG